MLLKSMRLRFKTTTTKQGGRSIPEYANQLKNLWQKMDHYRCIKMKGSDDAAIQKDFIEKDQIYNFLAGLKAEFD